MSLLAGRVIHQGDQLRWLPAAGDTAAARKAFEIIGWDDGRELRPRPDAAPTAVQNLAVNPTGVGQLSLAWAAPATGTPTSYTVLMTTTTGQASSTQTLVTSNTSVQYSTLSPASSYAFMVTASDANGSGPAATASFGSVEDVATQPLALSAVVGSGSGEFVLSWNPPADDGGSPALSYTATVYQGNLEQTVTTTSTSFTFSGLAPAARRCCFACARPRSPGMGCRPRWWSPPTAPDCPCRRVIPTWASKAHRQCTPMRRLPMPSSSRGRARPISSSTTTST